MSFLERKPIFLLLFAVICQDFCLGKTETQPVDSQKLYERASAKSSTSDNCGIPATVGTRIVGGNQSIAGKWPWQALFQIFQPFGSPSSECGGTLISNQWIITAAQCTRGKTARKLHILLGTLNYYNLETTTRKAFPVAQIIEHPDYDVDTHVNDISLLKLGGEVTYTNYIRPACLPTEGRNVTVGLMCSVSGWGDTKASSEPRNILREASVPIVSNSDCQSWYSTGSSVTISSTQVCAGSKNGGVDTCQGDTGGPLVCQANSTSAFQLEGVTSFGIGCALSNYPRIYTRVSEYVSWIETETSQTTEADPFFSLPQTACETTISTDRTVRLPVGSETQMYLPSTTCAWTLRPPDSSTTNITITFVERMGIETGASSGCYDTLKITDNSGSQIGSDVCGYDLPNAISISAGDYESVTLTFRSDGSVQYVGFAANISFVSTSTSPGTPPTSTSTPVTESPTMFPENCGNPAIVNTRIVGGNQSIAGKWPWQVLFQIFQPFGSPSSECGGTLISNQWIITAAQCTHGKTASNLHILLGTFNYHNLETTTRKAFPVAQIIEHPDYDVDTHVNDISLLKLGGEVTYTNYIRPACLPTEGRNVTVGLMCSVSGWGDTKASSEPRNILREASVPIVSNADCQSWYSTSPSVTISSTQVCAGPKDGGADACQGDTGGPLVCQANSTSAFQLEGVTSFRLGCGLSNYPRIYTRVSEYVSWIKNETSRKTEADTFFSLPQTACVTTITTDQTVRLPVHSETQMYLPLTTCVWTLRPPDPSTTNITITFVERMGIETGSSSGCFDTLKIAKDTGLQIGSDICGYDLPNPISISAGDYESVTLTFTSDFSVQYIGFAADIQFLTSPTTSEPVFSFSTAPTDIPTTTNFDVSTAPIYTTEIPTITTAPSTSTNRTSHAFSTLSSMDISVSDTITTSPMPTGSSTSFSVTTANNATATGTSTNRTTFAIPTHSPANVSAPDNISTSTMPTGNTSFSISTTNYTTPPSISTNRTTQAFSTPSPANVSAPDNTSTSTMPTSTMSTSTMPTSTMSTSTMPISTMSTSTMSTSTMPISTMPTGNTAFSISTTNYITPPSTSTNYITPPSTSTDQTTPAFPTPTPTNSFVSGSTTTSSMPVSNTAVSITSTEPATSSYPGCGLPTILDSRVVGGSETTAGKWPWQAALQATDAYGDQSIVCGGTLINEKWVVTATHCLEGIDAEHLHVLLGTVDYNSRDEPFAREYPTSKIVSHPDYISATQGHDISLIKIGANVTMSEYIFPACLPGQGVDVQVGLNCTVTGWGDTQVITDDLSVLREAVVPIISNSLCSTWYSGILFYGIKDIHLCAGYESGGVDTCQGDSGGPLVCQANPSAPFQLEGITSFGSGCAEARRPGVYIRVSEYVAWIEGTMRNHPGTEPFFALPQTPCGSIIDTNQTLRLPVNGETQIYDKSTSCVWNLKTKRRGLVLKFVERFTVEKGARCYDYVRIVSDNGHRITHKLCGYTLPSDVIIPPGAYDAVTLKFVSDFSVQFAGFAVKVSFQNSSSSTEPPTTGKSPVSRTTASTFTSSVVTTTTTTAPTSTTTAPTSTTTAPTTTTTAPTSTTTATTTTATTTTTTDDSTEGGGANGRHTANVLSLIIALISAFLIVM